MKTCAVVLSTLLFCSVSIVAQSGGKNAISTSTMISGINLRSVPGAPFSADVIRQTAQQMPDGTTRQTETHGKIFRDGLGRTRTETEFASASGVIRHFVTIVDPVQKVTMMLDVEAKTAKLAPLPVAKAVGRQNLKLLAMAQKSSRPMKGTEDLGGMTIEGFMVTGTRHIDPAVAGAQKETNQNLVREAWFSPELEIELMAKTQSALMTRTTKLAGVTPGEPDPLLFQVPADYAVQASSAQKVAQ